MREAKKVLIRIIYVVISSYKSQTSQSVGQGPRLNTVFLRIEYDILNLFEYLKIS